MGPISDLVADLTHNRRRYSAIEKRVVTELKEELPNPTFLWQSRVKTAASLEKKLGDRGNEYENEADNVAKVCDLVGVRIILAHPGDVRQVEECVKKTFKFVRRTQHPKDKINMVDSKKRFRGYNAIHLYVALQGRPDEQDQNPIIEIQVMHSFMWVYATLHHNVVYKELYGEPSPELLSAIDLIRGVANIGELAAMMYDERFITRDVDSELKSTIQSAVKLNARCQSVLQLTIPQCDKDSGEPCSDQWFEDLASEEYAYDLLRKQPRDKETHLEGVAEARQILRPRLAMFSHDGPPSIRHLRMLHHLAIAERTLSLRKNLDTGTMMEHLDQAERYIDKAIGMEVRSGLVGAREQMTLEWYIVRGLRAKLEFRIHITPVRILEVTRWRLSEASAGIGKALEDLEKVDVVKYEKNTKFGLRWINDFLTFHTKS